MCGFIGGFWSRPGSPSKTLFSSALSSLVHRGPDDKGTFFSSMPNGVLGLGHQRLSIIDLSTSGRQPMESSDGRYSMVFNGEIYNYRELRDELISHGVEFSSNSDSEVLLNSWAYWREDCLLRLKGMFAFVVFDRRKETLFCVRDSFGIKPLYYSLNKNGFFFSSELPALHLLLDQKNQVNLQRAYDFLVFDSYDDCEATFTKGIKQLMPAHSLSIDLNANNLSPKVSPWWRPAIKERQNLPFDVAAEELREMFLQNVRLHLRSDVKVGANLSGGLDSASLVCSIRHLEPEMPLHTFSYVARGSPVNEESWVDKINHHAKAIPHKVTISSEEFDDEIDEMIRIQGEPFGSTSLYAQYRVFRMAKEHGVTVTLDGQGADEMLAGYHGYPQARLLSLLERKKFVTLFRFLKEWPKWPGRSRQKIYSYLMELLLPRSFRDQAMKRRGWDPRPDWIDVHQLHDQGVKVSGSNHFVGERDGVGRRLPDNLRFALTKHKLIHLLRVLDRNSMHWSIESRVPFLTNDMAEFLLSLPEEFLLSSGGQTKRIFRAAMRDIVPREILERKDKVGFATPEREWLLSSRKKVLGWLESLDSVSFLRKEKCHDVVSGILNGSHPFSWQAWRLVNFAQWYSIHTGSHSAN